MMDIKMVCCDIDGTLLKDDKSISESSKQMIKLIQKQGVSFALASGRSYEGIQKVWEELDTMGYSICYNGNLVYYQDTVIYRHGFHMKDLKPLLAVLSRYHIEGFLCTETRDYLAERLYQTIRYDTSKWARNPSILADNQYDCLYDIDELVYKISLHIEDVQLAHQLHHAIEHLPFYMVKAEMGYYDIVMEGHQKGDGVKFLSEYLSIKRENIVCIGDNENDISMIIFAGMGVAMGNATNKVKKYADFIGESNENDGVAKLLASFIV